MILLLYFIFITGNLFSAQHHLSFPGMLTPIQKQQFVRFQSLCNFIQTRVTHHTSRQPSCFISRAYPDSKDPLQIALNTWADTFNRMLKNAGMFTYYDEFGTCALNTNIVPFINKIGEANAVFPLLTPCFRSRPEADPSCWLNDEISAYTDRQNKSSVGLHPVLLAGNCNISVPEKMSNIKNSYFYSMVGEEQSIDTPYPWPNWNNFLKTMLEILTPNDKGLTRWISREKQQEILCVIDDFNKTLIDESLIYVAPTPPLHLFPSQKTNAATRVIENISFEIDTFFHQRTNEFDDNYLCTINKKLQSLARLEVPKILKALHLVGYEGSGKTYLARRFAQDALKESKYDIIWWFSSDNEGKFKEEINNFYNILRTKGLLTGNDIDFKFQFQSIQSMLHFTNSCCLLIYDNVNNDFMKKYVFKTHNSSINILTTCRYVSASDVINVGNFTAIEAIRYMKNYLAEYNYETYDEKKLEYITVKLLHCLPAAVAQTASYIVHHNISLDSYIKQFKEDPIHIIQYESKNDFPQAISTSLLLVYNKLSKDAKKIFNMCCLLDVDQIPLTIFSKAHTLSPELSLVYEELKKSGLIHVTGCDIFTYVTIHKFFKTVINVLLYDDLTQVERIKKKHIIYIKTLAKLRNIIKFSKKKLVNFQDHVSQWYYLLKSVEKCIDSLKSSVQEEYSSNDHYAICSTKKTMRVQSELNPLMTTVLTSYNEQKSLDKLIWEEVGIKHDFGEDIKEIFTHYCNVLECSKYALYSIIKKYSIERRTLLRIEPFITTGVVLWDLKFLLKNIQKISESTTLSNTTFLYMQHIMEKNDKYPGLASAFSYYIYYKTHNCRPLSSLSDITEILNPDYILSIYHENEKQYSTGTLQILTLIELLNNFTELYNLLTLEREKTDINYYSTILYCYEHFGFSFLKPKIYNLKALTYAMCYHKKKKVSTDGVENAYRRYKKRKK